MGLKSTKALAYFPLSLMAQVGAVYFFAFAEKVLAGTPPPSDRPYLLVFYAVFLAIPAAVGLAMKLPRHFGIIGYLLIGIATIATAVPAILTVVKLDCSFTSRCI